MQPKHLANCKAKHNRFDKVVGRVEHLCKPEDPSFIPTDSQCTAPMPYHVDSMIPCHETSGPELPDSN